ncbi:hypothetical protein Stsp02_55820 [Streptomyces sp. NBRC 14336]|nr:hypothetical protein Stsp02_55820 [Streptomyces sp. NBRC 14336]
MSRGAQAPRPAPAAPEDPLPAPGDGTPSCFRTRPSEPEGTGTAGPGHTRHAPEDPQGPTPRPLGRVCRAPGIGHPPKHPEVLPYEVQAAGGHGTARPGCRHTRRAP